MTDTHTFKFRINLESGTVGPIHTQDESSRKRAQRSVAPPLRAKRVQTVQAYAIKSTANMQTTKQDFTRTSDSASNKELESDECVVVEELSARPTVMQFAHGYTLCLNKPNGCGKCYCEICDIPSSECTCWNNSHCDFHNRPDFLSVMKQFAMEERRRGRPMVVYNAQLICSRSMFLSGALTSVQTQLFQPLSTRPKLTPLMNWSSDLIHLVQCNNGFDFMVDCILTRRFKFFNDVVSSIPVCNQWAVFLAHAMSYSNSHLAPAYIDKCLSLTVSLMRTHSAYAIALLYISCSHAWSLKLYVAVLKLLRASTSNSQYDDILQRVRTNFRIQGPKRSTMIVDISAAFQFVTLVSETSGTDPELKLKMQLDLHMMVLMDFYTFNRPLNFMTYYNYIEDTELFRTKFADFLMTIMKDHTPLTVNTGQQFVRHVLLHTLRK
jgi:hypothetical protein